MLSRAEKTKAVREMREQIEEGVGVATIGRWLDVPRLSIASVLLGSARAGTVEIVASKWLEFRKASKCQKKASAGR